MNRALSNYQKNQVAGMTQQQLIVMLYNGALKFLDQAEARLAEENIDQFADQIERIHRIVYHLYTTLNFDEGGEIAERLGALYSFIISQLYILNSTKDLKLMEDIRGILTVLRDGWQNAGHLPEGVEQLPDNPEDMQDSNDKEVSVQV